MGSEWYVVEAKRADGSTVDLLATNSWLECVLWMYDDANNHRLRREGAETFDVMEMPMTDAQDRAEEFAQEQQAG